jgi:hypothetical protein
MKIILSILLLFITSLYILPVKETLTKGNAVCMADMDEEKEENEKKEKSKELFAAPPSVLFISESICCLSQHITFNIPVSHYTIDTPPPDYTA